MGGGNGRTRSPVLCAWERDLSSAPPAAVTITGPCSATYTEQAWMLRMSCKGVQSPQKSYLECWRTEQIQQKEACIVQSFSLESWQTEKAEGEAQDSNASRVRTRNSTACGQGLLSTLRIQVTFQRMHEFLQVVRLHLVGSPCASRVPAGIVLANETSASHWAVNFAALAGLNVGVFLFSEAILEAAGQ